MSRSVILSCGAAVLCTVFSGSLLAEQGGGKVDRRAKLLKEFDQDGNGQLDQQERRAARQAIQQRRGQGGNGRQGNECRDGDQGSRRPSREQIMAKFDLDGDGQLSDEERRAMRQFIKQRRGGNRGPGNANQGQANGRGPRGPGQQFGKRRGNRENQSGRPRRGGGRR